MQNILKMSGLLRKTRPVILNLIFLKNNIPAFDKLCFPASLSSSQGMRFLMSFFPRNPKRWRMKNYPLFWEYELLLLQVMSRDNIKNTIGISILFFVTGNLFPGFVSPNASCLLSEDERISKRPKFRIWANDIQSITVIGKLWKFWTCRSLNKDSVLLVMDQINGENTGKTCLN